MRRVLSEIFARPTPTIQKYFGRKTDIDARIPPCDLMLQLKNKKKMKSFIEMMNQKQKNGLRVLKKLIVMHWCLIYSADLCEGFKRVDMKQSSESQWLDQNVIKPYRLFLSKLCHSSQFYRAIQVSRVVQFSLENMFFVIKLLKDLFECKKKISSLHHYYSKQTETQYPFLLDNFVCILACHAQRIYSVFKAILSEFIRFPKIFIVNEQLQGIMKFIMEEELVDINEEMRQLFLSSIYYPYGKGYGIKLLKIEELPDQTREYAESILYPEQQKRRVKKATLDSLLFDKTGGLNSEVYRGLQQITKGEDATHNKELSAFRSRAVMRRQRNCGEQIEQV